MASSHLIRLGTIKGKSGVLEALKHNKRALQAERGASANIDVTRTPQNYTLSGDDTPANIALHAKVQMLKAGIEKPRTNAVMAVEVIFSLPIDRHKQDTRPFFTDCLTWVKDNLAGELLSFDVHLDESAPHAHAVILPLIDHKLQGNKLIGNKGNLYRLINVFHQQVASRYGLSRNETKRLSPSDKEAIEREVLRSLKQDSVMKSSIWACVRDAIHRDPLTYAQVLSINLDESVTPSHALSQRQKSFVDYKRAKGKGSFVR